MIALFEVILLSVVTILSGFAPALVPQTNPSPSPTGSPATEPARAQDEVVRVSTELVQTDVTVLDKSGRFVEGLQPEQFELLVDGKPHAIAFFDRVTAGSNQETALLTRTNSRSSTPAGNNKSITDQAPAAPATVLDRGRTTFFFVDDLHLSPGSIKRTQDLLLKFVDQGLGPKDQAVIATASGQLGFLQQVTADRVVLRTAIERLKYRSANIADTLTDPPMNEFQATAIENNDREALGYFVDKQCEEFKRMGRGSCAPDTGMTNNAVYDDAVARNRQGGTMGTSPGPVPVGDESTGRTRNTNNQIRPEAERLIRSRARIIARLSAQVTLNTLASLESLIRNAAPIPERKLVVFISDGFFINYLNSTNAYDIRRITDAALRTGTVIYTVDARGLVTGVPDASTKGSPDTQGRFARLAIAEVTAAQDPLNALANDTGGRAWRNSNDLAPGVVQALRETSSYYLIAWCPEPGQAKDHFRRIEIKVKDRPDLTVRMRRGFFEDSTTAANNTNAAKRPATAEEELLAIIRSTYPKHTLPTTLSVGYVNGPDKGMSVMASMLIETAAGNSPVQGVDVMGAVVNEKGDVISSLQQHLTSTPSSTGDSRLVYTMQFPNLASGLYQVRLATRDSQRGLTGDARQWIEMPDTSKGQFQISTVFLSEVRADAGQKATVSPDSRFARTSRLRFQGQIFNAEHASKQPELTLQLKLTKDGQVLVATPPSPISIQGATDFARIAFTGEFPLSGFPPGQYELELTITDLLTKASVSARSPFTVQ